MADLREVQIGLRVPKVLKDALELMAKRERRSLNAQATIVIEEGLKAMGAKPKESTR